jgi:ABC-type multidrug transport system ATPase subunit
MAPVIDVTNLSKSFGKHAIISGLSLAIEENEVYGLVGLNGAGKTTLIRLLLGILKPGGGTITVAGRDPWAHDAAQYRRFGVVLEHDGFWGNLTFEQNLRLFAAAKRVPWSDACRYVEVQWRTSALYKNKKPVKFFSRGQRMQCAICRAFLGDPAVFFFDEPVVALDIDAYEHFSGLVKTARSRGATFLISSHQLDAIDDLCSRVGALRDKKIIELTKTGRDKTSGPTWELLADPNARWASLIMEVCGSAAVFKNGSWFFDVVDPEAMVPVLVAKLAGAGCQIRAIAPAAGGFREVIRKEYRGRETGLGEGGAA